MSDLKTLKDLKQPMAILTAYDSTTFMKMERALQEEQPHFVDYDRLRKEAKKWKVKENPNKEEFYQCGFNDGVNWFIKHFFNQEDKDDKD